MSDEAPQRRSTDGGTRLPSAVTVAWMVASGATGFVGSELRRDEQPAVMAQSVEMLREDVRTIALDMREMRESTEAQARTAVTKEERAAWLREQYGPSLVNIHGQLRTLERDVLQLQQHHTTTTKDGKP